MSNLKLNLEIYSVQSISKACDAYKDYARIDVVRDEKFVEFKFNECKYDQELTIKEFENYLINVENE